MISNHMLILAVIFLSVIILMCSCGGGIRVRENFLDEVVGYSGDDLEETNVLDSSVENVQEVMPTNTEKMPVEEESKSQVPVDETISEETEMPLNQNKVQPNNTSHQAKPLLDVTGYSDCEYAKF